MMQKLVLGTVLLAAFVACMLFLAPPSFAAGAATPTPAPAANARSSTCSQYPGLTNRIASCIRDSVDSATADFFTGFYPLVSRAITGFISLVIVIYGIMAASGQIEQPGKDTVMLLLKIAMVGYFTTNVDVMHREVVSAMDSIGSSVVRYSPGSGVADTSGTDFSQSACLKTMRDAAAANGVGTNGPWLGVDCLIDSVIGIKISDAVAAGNSVATTQKYYRESLDNTKSGVARGFIYIFASGMKTSVMGAILAAIGFLFIYGLVFLIGKILLVYLAAYIGIALLMIISPLFIPLVLMQRTREYFDKWVKLVINFALQPIIMLIFMVFTITAVDFAAFSGDYSFAYRVAGRASRQQGFNMNDYLTKPHAPDGSQVSDPTTDSRCTPVNGQNPCDAAITKASTKAAQIKAQNETSSTGGTCNTDKTVVNGLCESKCVRSVIDPKSSTFDKKIADDCAKSYDIIWQHDTINWKRLAEMRDPAVVPEAGATPGEQIAREALASVIFCAIVVFVMNQLVKVIPVVAVDLLGDFGQSPNLAKFYGGTGRGALKGGINKVTGGISDSISNMITKRGAP